MEDKQLTPEQFSYLDHRYHDLKQIIEAVPAYFPPEELEGNHFWDTIVFEFDYLAELLGFEDYSAFLDRLIKNDNLSDDEESST